jgi:hypothetical protein
VVGDSGQVEPVVDMGEQQSHNGFGDRCRRVTEPDADLAVLAEYIIDGHAQNPGDRLGVEQRRQRPIRVGCGMLSSVTSRWTRFSRWDWLIGVGLRVS